MIKLCSSVQVSSVLYCQFRSPWLNSCINLANRKEPLIRTNSDMHWGGRIVSLQRTHSFFVVFELPWCAQNKIGRSQCPPQLAKFCTLHSMKWCKTGHADGDGQQAEECCAVTPFMFPETCVLSWLRGHCAWPTAQDHLIAWARIWTANCHVWHMKTAILSLMQKNWNSMCCF